MLFIKSQKGFSLIEAVVGMVLLAILVGAILSVTLGDKSTGQKKLTFNASCKAEAQRLMSEFKGKGLIRDYYRFPPRPVGPGGPLLLNSTVSVPVEAASSEDGLLHADRWNDSGAAASLNTPFTTGNPNPLVPNLTILRPYTLIMGTMSTLETIYNNFPAVCGALPGMAATSAPAPLNTIFQNTVGVEDNTTSNTGLFQPLASLHIRLFDTATGAPILPSPCGGQHDHVAMPNSSPTGMLNIFPPGMTSNVNFPPGPPAPAVQIGEVHPGVRFNAGYEVTFTVRYNARDGTTPSCSVTEKFQYPLNMADPARPLRIDDVDAAETPADDADTSESINTFIPTSIPPASSPTLPANIDYAANGGRNPFRACTAAAAGTLNFRVSNARRGSVYMCRNLTRQRMLNDTAALNTYNIATISATRHRLNVLRVGGLRQSFFSTELAQNATSFDNDDTSVANLDRPPATANALTGFHQFNTLYYPFGSYFCDTADGCPNLPRFDTEGAPANLPAGPIIPESYRVFRPNTHASNTNTTWNNVFKTGRWVPCEYAQIACATNEYSDTNMTTLAGQTLRTPTTQFVAGSGTVSDGYHIQYAGLPSGCEVHMQVAEVDSAYNVRTIEFYEYTHEAAPGNRLVHITTRPTDEWTFNCFPSGSALDAAVPCPVITARTAVFPQAAATYDVSGPTCYINYPGSPVGAGGVWKANPATTEAGP
jgi:prepilin-type N-terminal cleavage/methylation domain-containing protein